MICISLYAVHADPAFVELWRLLGKAATSDLALISDDM